MKKEKPIDKTKLIDASIREPLASKARFESVFGYPVTDMSADQLEYLANVIRFCKERNNDEICRYLSQLFPHMTFTHRVGKIIVEERQ